MKQYIKLISLIVWLLTTYIVVDIIFSANAEYVDAKDIEYKETTKPINNKTEEDLFEEKKSSTNNNVNNEVVINNDNNYEFQHEIVNNNVSDSIPSEDNTNIVPDENNKQSDANNDKDITEDNNKTNDKEDNTPVDDSDKEDNEPIPPEIISEDVFILDIKDVSISSGEIDILTGNILENKRRIYTTNYYKVKLNTLSVQIENGFILTIYEYDSNKNYLGYVEYNNESIYIRKDNVTYIRVGLKASDHDIEKTLSLGGWASKLNSGLIAKLFYGDFNDILELNKQIKVSSNISYSANEIGMKLLNDEDVNDMLWNTLITNGKYKLDVNKFDFINRKTYYIAPDGDDDNSGLSIYYPKKTVNSLSGVNNINILFECGKTYNFDSSFKVGSNVTIASFGEGSKPIIRFYQKLDNNFSKVADNIYVTDLKKYNSLYNGLKNKSDCNIGHLLINNNINWKRIVFSSDEEYSNDLLYKNRDNLSWVVDYKNGLLYLYSDVDPNNYNIEFAPPITGFSSNGNNIIIQGIEIMGVGNHAINFTNTNNVNINNCSFKYIGGSVISSGGARYGNAIQFWNSTNNVVVEYNYARWIFDTCYTIQGNSEDMTVRNNRFSYNIGVHSEWGLELWGGPKETNSNNVFNNNILMYMGDITNPYTKMQVSGSGHLYGEETNETYITYRYGYSYHQAANLALWLPNESYLPDIYNNIFWGTNRFLVIGTWSSNEIDINTLKNNLFYEDYHLSYNTKPALYKFKYDKNMYFTSILDIVKNNTNTESLHLRDTYDNNIERNILINLILTLFNKAN